MFCFFYFFFFNDTATTEIYTLSLHDALPIFAPGRRARPDLDDCRSEPLDEIRDPLREAVDPGDRPGRTGVCRRGTGGENDRACCQEQEPPDGRSPVVHSGSSSERPE